MDPMCEYLIKTLFGKWLVFKFYKIHFVIPPFVSSTTGRNQGYEIIHNRIKQSVPVEQSTGIFLSKVLFIGHKMSYTVFKR